MAVGYVLINVEPGLEREVLGHIRAVEYVEDATLLFGDHDIIAKLIAPELGLIASTVVSKIRQINGVIHTKTLAGAEI
ncbi:MAG: Lrp/AsnC ligand binding domain-containing protein [Candidatus Poseidoniales archaeon]|jgi:DNA-binding Lrp family transcriptional regulator